MLWDERKILSVSDIIAQIKSKLQNVAQNVWVQGEVSNMKPHSSGHMYFTLKDSNAQIPAVMWRRQRRSLKFLPENGMELLVHGSISVYTLGGKVQLHVSQLEPLGKGALQIAFEQLKERLAKEGLFDEAHKLRLPLLPRRVGVVTSRTGAALQDILTVLQKRNDRTSILIYPTTVQGPTAPLEIARGIQCLSRWDEVDVIIIARGGGSWEDLCAFNDEDLARTVFESKTPVISAVGHESDFTITDFVADYRSPTPSAAAETVSGGREELCQQLTHLTKRTIQAMSLILQKNQERLQGLKTSRGFVDAETRIRFFMQRLDELSIRLQQAIASSVDPVMTRSQQVANDLEQQIHLYLKDRRHSLKSSIVRLQALSPLSVLTRGYSIVTTKAGQLVRSAAQVSDKDFIQVQTAQGSFRAIRKD